MLMMFLGELREFLGKEESINMKVIKFSLFLLGKLIIILRLFYNTLLAFICIYIDLISVENGSN